ncbi:MAG: hypothetical protein GC181_15500 [Bacteroidetes bacterium]|nr:hypothetical protein [Bacteroidota bacterium]
MRRLLLPLFMMTFTLFGINGCVEEVIVVPQNPVANVSYDFWAGARNVEVDGEIYNDGNTFIRNVELEIRMYDEYNYYISSVFTEFVVNLNPGQYTSFSLDVRERYVYNVEVFVNSIR